MDRRIALECLAPYVLDVVQPAQGAATGRAGRRIVEEETTRTRRRTLAEDAEFSAGGPVPDALPVSAIEAPPMPTARPR